MSKDNKNYPFHYIKYPTLDQKQEMPFIEDVKKILSTDMQQKEQFGCKICNCHTHAGSKIHFTDFIEAELLFHNNYYNQHFAQLSFHKLIKEKEKDYNNKNVVLISYENYSELYLQELKKIFIDNQVNLGIKKCSYCVYKTNSVLNADGARNSEVEIKNLKILKNVTDRFVIEEGNEENTFNLKDTICIFIVPINTTLSTMDKMIAKFVEDTNIKDNLSELTCKFISLITLGNQEGNDYWVYNDGYLNAGNCFEYISKSQINNLIYVPVNWEKAKNCKECFPQNTEDETPLFGVNRGSVVPMLKLGMKDYLRPINNDKVEENKENLKKVFELSEFLRYEHIVRGENHFQYYFNIERFLEKYKNKIQDDYLNKVKLGLKDNIDSIVFDFIVAPRHQTNALWVSTVNEKVFNGLARIMYFDSDKEFRSNIKAKYSDFIYSLENIQNSNEDYKIRFHYVDDTIHSGSTFLRAKNLIESLTSVIKDTKKVSLFDSVILLVNRLSIDTQRFYLHTDKYFQYVNVNISPMRRHDDACTLCKIKYDYYKIRQSCSLNKLADICSDVIIGHREVDILDKTSNQVKRNKFNIFEKRLIFYITHYLMERVSNKIVMDQGDDKPIDIESNTEDIIKVLEKVYCDNKKCTSQHIEKSKDLSEEKFKIIWQIAFIKAISRPFFSYHIRQRQAAFKFCLQKLNRVLENHKSQYSIEESMLVLTLVKALVDMNSNFILREDNFNKLVYLSVSNANKMFYQDDEEWDKYVKYRLWKSESVLHYFKKLIMLCRDTTKSLKLEELLINKSFWESKDKDSSENIINKELYLENNIIIKECLSKESNLELISNNIDKAKEMYFLTNFWELVNKNASGNNIQEIVKKYKVLKDNIYLFFSSHIRANNNLDQNVKELFGKDDVKALWFVRDATEKNKLFKYFSLTKDLNISNNSLMDSQWGKINYKQVFYSDDNITKIDRALNTKQDIYFLKEEENESNKSIIIRFSKNKEIGTALENNGKTENEQYQKNIDESIYLQLWGFNKEEQSHWFVLKIIMTLRDDVAKMISNINLQEMIEEYKLDMQRTALSINKSSTHSKAEKYFMANPCTLGINDNIDEGMTINESLNTLFENQEGLDFYDSENNVICEKDVYGLMMRNIGNIKNLDQKKWILYDKYFQLLADEIISSLYRKIIKYGENEFLNIIDKTNLDLKIALKQLFGLKDNQISLVIHKLDKIKVCNIKFDFKSDATFSKRLATETNIDSNIFIILLMAMNVVEHQKDKDQYQLKVYVNEKGLQFVSNAEDEEDIKYGKRFWHIPPWVFPANDQHITLWTFMHLKDFKVCVKQEKKQFIVEFNLGDDNYDNKIL